MDLRFSVKHLSFMTGKYPTSIVAIADGHCQMCLSIFLIVRYTGHACLSPLKAMRLVLSLARMTDDTSVAAAKIDMFAKNGYNKCNKFRKIMKIIT